MKGRLAMIAENVADKLCAMRGMLKANWESFRPVPSAGAALLEQLYGSAVVFAWTAVPRRMEWRYSIASAKLLALDAGHLCQNLYLACEAIGAGGEEEFAIYLATVGKLK
jgi:nitroreductase